MEQNKGCKVLEIGAGASPYLDKETIKKYNLKYTISDIDSEQIRPEIDPYYSIKIFDAGSEKLDQTFDLILSHMVLEHIKSPEKFHDNIKKMLAPAGRSIHFFATKYGVPSISNTLLPSKFTEWIVYRLQKRDPKLEGKFPAYYRQCYGPTASAKRWFKTQGYSIILYNGYLGHGYLYHVPVLNFIEQQWNKFIKKLASPYFTSNAILVLQKKETT